MRKFWKQLFLVVSVIAIILSCSKEITDDIFNFRENFFSVRVEANTNRVAPQESVTFSLDLQENDLPSIYTLSLSTNREGSFNTSQNQTIEAGEFNFTYLPVDEGIHRVNVTVTNANDVPLSFSEDISIEVGDVSNLETGFSVQVIADSETVTIDDNVSITVNIIEEADVPENVNYTIDFAASQTGDFAVSGQNFTNEGQITTQGNQLVFTFTPEEIGEYDFKFTTTSSFDGSDFCETTAFTVTPVISEIPVITLNGENPLILTVGDNYIETATVTDDIDTDIEIVFGGDFGGTTNTAGEFTRTYNATDSDDNVAEEQTRTIIIQDSNEVTLIETITITPEALELAVGGTQQLETSFTPQDPTPTNTTIEWESLDESVATVDDVTGMVTAVGPGSAEIVVSALDGSGVTATVPISVDAAEILVQAISVAPNELTLEVGDPSTTLVATVFPANASNAELVWSSNNTSSVTVNPTSGVIEAVGGGSAIITATAQDGSGVSGIASITVTVPVTSVEIDYTTTTVEVGGTIQLNAIISPPDATNKNVTWSSSRNEASGIGSSATVSETGVVTGVGRITGPPGIPVSITLTSEDGNFTDNVILSVIAPNSPPSVTLSASPISGTAPLTVTYTATASDPDNDTITYDWGIFSTSTSNSITRSFNSAGTFITSVTVSDGNGGANTATRAVTVTNNIDPCDAGADEVEQCELLGGTWQGGTNCICIPCGTNGQVCP